MSRVQAAPSLLESLAAELEARGVGWCHFKSNVDLRRGTVPDGDLDLLIRPGDARAYLEVLAGLGFREARAPRRDELPGVLHHFGHDPGRERLLHVHSHFRLVVGHDRTKSWRLPLEAALADGAEPCGALRLPPPELELLVFLLRMALKFGAWEAALLGQGRVPPRVREEKADLEARAGKEALERARAAWLPFVPAAVVEDAARSLEPGAPLGLRLRTASRLHRCLEAHARRGRGADVALKLARRAGRSLRRRLPGGVGGPRLAAGGSLVALVGGDGAGKSTAIAGLRRWLGKDLDLRVVHLGRPPRSLTTRVLRAALKAARAVVPGLERTSRMVWSVCASRDRYRAYVRARRAANDGALVLCDRYPVPGLRLMDAPGVERIAGERPSRLARRLAALEGRWYRAITPPELLLVLRLDPEEAVRRKTDEPAHTVRPRSREVWEFDWSRTGAVVVDASRPAAEVLAALRDAIWKAL